MKTIVKIEIALLVIVLLVAAGMILVSEGVLNLFREPVIAARAPLPIPTEAIIEAPEASEPGVVPPEKAKDPRVISAQKYFAFDIREDGYLAKQGDGAERVYPASITKLLTCYTLLQHMEPDTQVTVGDALKLVQWDSSVAGLQKGDRLTVEQLIEGMMLPSGNDAATVLATTAGRVIAEDYAMAPKAAINAFMKEMNRTAKSYGMSDSHFITPDGYHDPDHYTTMEDLAVLGRLILATPSILKYTALPNDQIMLSEDRVLEWKNTNALINPESEFYCSAAMGLKTGQHTAAGRCLLSAFEIDGRILIIGVFGCTEDPGRFEDTLQLLQQTIG